MPPGPALSATVSDSVGDLVRAAERRAGSPSAGDRHVFDAAAVRLGRLGSRPHVVSGTSEETSEGQGPFDRQGLIPAQNYARLEAVMAAWATGSAQQIPWGWGISGCAGPGRRGPPTRRPSVPVGRAASVVLPADGMMPAEYGRVHAPR